MQIAVVGATGTIGKPIAEQLAEQGHEVRELSRRSAAHPVDLSTGSGLAEALAGCEVVVDASNGRSVKQARAVLVEGSRRLLEAEASAGVGHHVCVSIVGIDQVPTGYYGVKVEQERVLEQGSVPWTIVQSTQFHDLIAGVLSAAARLRVSPVASAPLQPVDVAEAAAAVVAAAIAPAQRRRVTVAGPEVQDLRALVRAWRQATGRRTLGIPVPLVGKAGRALREGALTCANPDARGTRTFADWLRTR